MDWKLFAGTFSLIFLAELGDKTQLAALGMVKDPADRWTVFAGAVAALAVSTLIAVLAGGWLSARIPPFYFKCAAGLLFLAFGAYSLVEAFRVRSPAPAAVDTEADGVDASVAAPPAAPATASAPAREIRASARLGWPARLALEAAVAFEDAAAARYLRLAGHHPPPALVPLLERLARDEHGHRDTLLALAGRHGDDRLRAPPPPTPRDAQADEAEKILQAPTERATTTTAVASALALATESTDSSALPASMLSEKSGASSSSAAGGGVACPASFSAEECAAISALVEHEEASSAFYAALADASRLEGLRSVFASLSAAEGEHAAYLRRALENGPRGSSAPEAV